MEDISRLERLLPVLARAEDALSRLDERVRACSFRQGWSTRLDFLEAAAWGWNAGQVVSVEDLLLHDEAMDVRMPDQALQAAHGVIRSRRKASAAGPELLTPAGVAWLAGRRSQAPASPRPASPQAAMPLATDEPLLPQLVTRLRRLQHARTEDGEAAFGEWLAFVGFEDPRLPLALQAAVALEAWDIIALYPRQSYVGPVLVAHWLRAQARVASHLPGLETGVRAVRRRAFPPPREALEAPLLYCLDVFAESGSQGTEELNRLELARQAATRRAGPRPGHSHMPALIELFLERPLVTAPLAAQRLKVSGQTARRLIGELGGSVAEVSGQKRYRAWRL